MSCRLTVHPPSRTACVFAVVEWEEKGVGGAKVGGALWRDRLDRAALPIWFPQLAGTAAQAAACAVALPCLLPVQAQGRGLVRASPSRSAVALYPAGFALSVRANYGKRELAALDSEEEPPSRPRPPAAFY